VDQSHPNHSTAKASVHHEVIILDAFARGLASGDNGASNQAKPTSAAKHARRKVEVGSKDPRAMELAHMLGNALQNQEVALRRPLIAPEVGRYEEHASRADRTNVHDDNPRVATFKSDQVRRRRHPNVRPDSNPNTSAQRVGLGALCRLYGERPLGASSLALGSQQRVPINA